MDRNLAFENNYIGQGWAFRPASGIGVSGEGGIALMSGEQDVAKSIFIILSTAPGERVMRTEFGCGIHDLVFASASPEVYGLVSFYVYRALGRWEPRIDVTDVKVGPDGNRNEVLLVDISYTIRDTNSERNLVYPFYVIPRGQD